MEFGIVFLLEFGIVVLDRVVRFLVSRAQISAYFLQAITIILLHKSFTLLRERTWKVTKREKPIFRIASLRSLALTI